MNIVGEVEQGLDSVRPPLRDCPVIVGVSGGADSLCLLSVLHRLAPERGLSLHVVHVEHGIRGQAAVDDAQFVQSFAESMALPCEVIRVDAPAAAAAPGVSLEEAARQLRYGALAKAAACIGAEAIFVGHHADDQVETVVMHWLRGAGLSGLRGMALESGFDAAWPDAPAASRLRLVRPLLGVWRSEIDAYCVEHGLAPRWDATNQDTTYLRNRLRHELIPLLETYNPRFKKRMLNTSQALAGDYGIVASVVDAAWQTTCLEEGQRVVFSAQKLGQLEDAVVRALVRRAVFTLRSSIRDVGWVHAKTALAIIRGGRTGARCALPGGIELALYYDEVVVAQAGEVAPRCVLPQYSGKEQALRCPGSCSLDDGWQLACHILERSLLPADWRVEQDPLTAYLDADVVGRLTLRTRKPGDRMRPLGMQGTRKVKDILIDGRIPRPARERLPLVESDGRLIWILGVRQGHHGHISMSTKRVLVLAATPPTTDKE